ncbi:MAG: asparagine synthetase B [Litorilinea sp.]|nr:MAG: asparagine synthetase B [Litorilinea sp.]
MCGIWGYLKIETAIADVPAMEAALSRLLHRGPDEGGSWCGEDVCLAMRRLSIIDLAGGQQPIWNEDRTCCIVYNGELYNYRELRPMLEAKGHSFRTRSDTEVILHAYEEWGADCLRRFNGMFALAIWDGPRRQLFLARDRIGEKPLYYFHDGRRLIFASEIKAILADPTVPRRLNPRGLANFLAFGHAVAPDTIYEHIHKLLPGHYLLAHAGGIRTVQYWDVGEEPQLAEAVLPDEEKLASHLLTLLDDAVRLRMVADVPVGAFLSGGVDSTAVVALMQRHTAERVQTFSLGFQIGGAYNELADARRVAQELGTQHHELQVEHLDLVETLQTLVYHYDEPFGDAAGFPLYLLSRFARQHVKVVLAGDGGDELFGGYRRYAAEGLAGLYQRLPGPLAREWLPALVGRLPRFRRVKRALQTLPVQDPARRYAGWLLLFSPEMQADLIQPSLRQAVDGHDPTWPYFYYYGRLPASYAGDHLNQLMYVDLKTWLADTYMEKTDKATMACSLEARLPFLDHRLVELAFQIPGHLKVRGWSTKRILKRALRSLVPSSVLQKPKHGFAVPTDPWFRGPLKDFTFQVLFDARTRQRGYFNMAVVERLWQEHQQGRHVWDEHLWLLLNFELWHRLFLDGDAL